MEQIKGIYSGTVGYNGTEHTKTRRMRMVCMTTSKLDKQKEDFLHKKIGIDSLSIYCLTSNLDDIDISTRKEVLHKVMGIGGKHSSTITNEGCDTFKLVIMQDTPA
jgi:hypothetical protein